MKLKLSDLVNAVQSLGIISKKDLPVKTSYALSKNIQKIDTELKAFNETRTKLFEKYGEKVKEDGKDLTRIPKEKVEIFQKELNTILDQEVEIDLWMIDINEFGCANKNSIDSKILAKDSWTPEEVKQIKKYLSNDEVTITTVD